MRNIEAQIDGVPVELVSDPWLGHYAIAKDGCEGTVLKIHQVNGLEYIHLDRGDNKVHGGFGRENFRILEVAK